MIRLQKFQSIRKFFKIEIVVKLLITSLVKLHHPIEAIKTSV